MNNKIEERLAIEAKGVYLYSDLRTCLDPTSEEWDQTSMQKKAEILKNLLANGHNLQDLIVDYKSFYIEMKKVDVAKLVCDGLIELLEYLLKDQVTDPAVVEG